MNNLNQIFQDYLAKHSELESVDFSQLIKLYPQYEQSLEKKIKAYQKINNLFNDNPPEETPSTLIGQVVGGCKIISIIGQGGMGVVYLAYQEKLRREVVLKILRPFAVANKSLKERFVRESRIVGRLNHKNILPVYDIGEEKESLYIIMKHVVGTPLNLFVQKISKKDRQSIKIQDIQEIINPNSQNILENKTSTEFFCKLISKVADAVQYAHEQGVVHRDIKPSNIIIEPDGNPVLLDFGLSHDEIEQNITMTGEFFGTPAYSAPELFLKNTPRNSPQLDVYSLGTTLYELLTGSLPYEGDSVYEIYNNLKNKEPIAPKSLWKSIPRDLETILSTSIAKEIEFRYSSSKDFQNDLENFICYQPIKAKAPSNISRFIYFFKRKKKPFLVIAIVSTLFLIIGFLILDKNKKDKILASESAKHLIQEARSELNINDAITKLNKAIILNPDNTEAIESLTFSYISNNQLELALKETEKLLNKSPNDSFYLGLRSLILFDKGDKKEADKNFESILPVLVAEHDNNLLNRRLNTIIVEILQRLDSENGTSTTRVFFEKQRKIGYYIFRDSLQTLEFIVPFKWKQATPVMIGEITRFYGPTEESSDPHIVSFFLPTLSYLEFPYVNSPEGVMKEEGKFAKGAYNGILTDWQIIKSKEQGDNSAWSEAILIIPRGSINYRLKMKQHMIFGKDKAYVLLGASIENKFDQHEIDFDVALNSFKMMLP